MIYVSEALLYVCFALLTGTFIIRMVPERLRPGVRVSNVLLAACALAVPVLSFAPIHKTAAIFAGEFDMPYFTILKQVLTDLDAGKAWLWTLIGSLGLTALLSLRSFRDDQHMPKVGLFITLLLVVWLGYASHSASLYGFKGIFVHSAHFLAVTVWIGVLFVAGWFARDHENWLPFLRWFSPLAIVCVLVSIGAGLILMTFTTPEYINSLMLPYGQMLAVKHLLLLPLLLFAYTNGFGYRQTLRRNESFNPRPWLRAESIFALLVFIATGILGQQTPPHNVAETLRTVSPSPMFTAIYRGSFSPDLKLAVSFPPESLLLWAAAVIMAVGLIWMYRSNRVKLALVMGALVSVFGYFGLMFAIA